WDRLLRPFLLAALNMAPEQASAELASAVVRDTLARGGRACMPRIASPNLAAAFVEPAVSYLRGHGAPVRFGERLRAIEKSDSAAVSLVLADFRIALSAADRVILAVPASIAAEL